MRPAEATKPPRRFPATPSNRGADTMLLNLYGWLPPEGVKILLVLLLSFMIGLEREEHKAMGSAYSFGGVRTFPLIGLIGYSLALLSGGQAVPIALGFL